MAKRPYAQDPLLRDGQGVWGSESRDPAQHASAYPEPQPPQAPPPAELPTLEWEKAE
jgi:hypothetical protein